MVVEERSVEDTFPKLTPPRWGTHKELIHGIPPVWST